MNKLQVTDFARAMYEDSYLLPNETIDDLYHRVAYDNCRDNPERAERIKSYFYKLWACGATPVMSNSGIDRGYPISCFTSMTYDSLESIAFGLMEDLVLGSGGGGIGRRKIVRGLGESISNVGTSSGKVPFLKVDDSMVNAVSQGALRRASKAEYLHISDPEIEEFIKIRKSTGGDSNRKTFNLHHAIIIPDTFIEKVINMEMWDLVSVKTGEVVKSVDAYKLFCDILLTRIETGEPYLMFEDNINRSVPELYKLNQYRISLSNLCSEVLLHTDEFKTAVCCLSSVNLEKYDEWKDDPVFIEDMYYFLDGVLIQYEEKLLQSPEWKKPFLHRVLNFVREERAVGLGVMGWHSLLQSKSIPFESPMAKGLNIKIFKDLREKADKASIKIAQERGSCELAKRHNILERFSHKLAIAPTSSISILCGGVSAGIEPWQSNGYVHKNKTKAETIKNKHLDTYIRDYAEKNGKDNRWVAGQWKSIIAHEGSVQHLDWMDAYIKEVFKTAFELDQRYIIEQASDRGDFIDQGQSTNIFLRHNIHKKDLVGLHLYAWAKKLKTLYYCRSTSPKRASIGGEVVRNKIEVPELKYESCLSCQ